MAADIDTAIQAAVSAQRETLQMIYVFHQCEQLTASAKAKPQPLYQL